MTQLIEEEFEGYDHPVTDAAGEIVYVAVTHAEGWRFIIATEDSSLRLNERCGTSMFEVYHQPYIVMGA